MLDNAAAALPVAQDAHGDAAAALAAAQAAQGTANDAHGDAAAALAAAQAAQGTANDAHGDAAAALAAAQAAQGTANDAHWDAACALGGSSYGTYWQDVKWARDRDATYTNTSGRARGVSIDISASANNTVGVLWVDGVAVARTLINLGFNNTLYVEVSDGHSYSLTCQGGYMNIDLWSERLL